MGDLLVRLRRGAEDAAVVSGRCQRTKNPDPRVSSSKLVLGRLGDADGGRKRTVRGREFRIRLDIMDDGGCCGLI
jgi:hypothetical protein